MGAAVLSFEQLAQWFVWMLLRCVRQASASSFSVSQQPRMGLCWCACAVRAHFGLGSQCHSVAGGPAWRIFGGCMVRRVSVHLRLAQVSLMRVFASVGMVRPRCWSEQAPSVYSSWLWLWAQGRGPLAYSAHETAARLHSPPRRSTRHRRVTASTPGWGHLTHCPVYVGGRSFRMGSAPG